MLATMKKNIILLGVIVISLLLSASAFGRPTGPTVTVDHGDNPIGFGGVDAIGHPNYGPNFVTTHGRTQPGGGNFTTRPRP